MNRTQYNMGYYLVGGIYPDFATFVKTISMPQGEKRKLFAQQQESMRRDVERGFGVLQSRFAIIRGTTRFWDVAIMKNIIYACIVLYNMIVEDEQDTYQNYIDYDGVDDDMSRSEISIGAHPNFKTTYLQRRADIHDKRIHRQLQADLY
uniref:DDE Tnp4 domain-containing protein n=1 Tax=Cajanus cajan TaxID=3821 RepID=A0A151RRQ2_CAJCA|nr:hypothetical protein KK1_033314 [Cajanus cajan]